MKVRKSKSITLEEALLAEARGAVLHPDLHVTLLSELEERECKHNLCRLPSTILETYHMTMEQRFALYYKKLEMLRAGPDDFTPPPTPPRKRRIRRKRKRVAKAA